MRIVVIGGGVGGLASAARLAKLGHQVTLVERLPTLGGAMSEVEADGFAWDAGPSYTLLPAVVRDLFRKSGRPLERELELNSTGIVREHRFADGSVLALPGESRAAQLRAFDELAPGLGRQWIAHVDAYTDDWEVLRRAYFENVWDPADLPAEARRRIDSRESLHKRLRKGLKDDRARQVAAHPFVAAGHDVRNVPAWAGLVAYLEQRFGAWTPVGGMARLTDALTQRLATRRVETVLGAEATGLVLDAGRVRGVRTTAGELEADAVVCAIDPRRLPELAPHVARTMPAMPPVVCHVGVSEALAEDLPHEVVLHGDPMLVVRTGGRAPAGGAAYTVHGRGRLAEDLLVALARHGLDLRRHLVTRVDRSPRDQSELWQSSPYGVLWQGRGTVRQRLGPRTPIPHVYAAGAHAAPGAGVAYAGLSGALVAQAIGPA